LFLTNNGSVITNRDAIAGEQSAVLRHSSRHHDTGECAGACRPWLTGVSCCGYKDRGII